MGTDRQLYLVLLIIPHREQKVLSNSLTLK